MLKQRVITALLLLPLVLAAIFYLPAVWFVLLLAVIMLVCAMEYVRLSCFSGTAATAGFVLVQSMIFALLFFYKDSWTTYGTMWLGGFTLAWLLLFTRLLVFRQDTTINNRYRTLSFITAIVSVSSGWFALSWLRLQDQGSWLIMLLLLIVWAADTGAYFSGKKFGKHKLAPHISPGKTIEGLVGGLLLATLISWSALQLLPLELSLNLPQIFALSLVTVLISVGGDLMVSMHKRISGFKDSGQILPGHGGFLDRLDSLLAAAPVFALGLHLATG